jgi:spermidine synthase
VSTPAASDAPPGYDDPNRRPALSVDPGGPPFWFALLAFVTIIGAAHELLATQAAAYLDPGVGPPRWLASSAGGVALLAGVFAARRLPNTGRNALPLLFAAASLVLSLSGYAWLFAFEHAELFGSAALAVPVVGSLALGAASGAAWRTLGRTVLALGGIDRLLAPLRLGAVALALGFAAAAAAAVGLLRTGAAIGLVLAVLAVWSSSLMVFVDRRPLAHPRLSRLACGAALGAGFVLLVAAEAVVPAAELGRHGNPIVYSSRSERARYVVTSGQDAFELFIDGQLNMSGIDEQRYHEALVHPAMLAAPRRARVLVLAAGHGAPVREVLRHADVEHVVLVTSDRALPDLANRVAWLRHSARGALASPKLEIVEAEAAVWLSEARGTFDVAIVDLPDPSGYVEAKNYTRHFYQRLAAVLAPDGVAGVQATSPFGSPQTFANIERTLRAAGLSTRPYRAPVPTFGDWGFVIASARPIRPPPAELDRWLSGTTRLEAFALPPDVRASTQAGVSTLHDPIVVETFAGERSRLGL